MLKAQVRIAKLVTALNNTITLTVNIMPTITVTTTANLYNSLLRLKTTENYTILSREIVKDFDLNKNVTWKKILRNVKIPVHVVSGTNCTFKKNQKCSIPNVAKKNRI